MNLLDLYYYTSIPLITGNMIYYSITLLSTSITSSQNVLHFIYEHKDCDSVIFSHEIDTLDIKNKLLIIESFIFNILQKYCINDEEFNRIKNNIKTPVSINTTHDNNMDFIMIELKNNNDLLNNINEPLRISLLSTYQSVNEINNLISIVNEKIYKYNNYYVKLSRLCLKKEIHELNQKINILDKRFAILLELLKVDNILK
jgi:hypothetical protein